MINPVVLFVPVSSDKGVGEYTRSLIIANALQKSNPNCEIHFILNRNMKSAKNCNYETHLSDHSATKDTPLVKSIISKIKPRVVIFDCAGRSQQFAHAQKVGAKVIFISQHQKKRAKGLSLRRLIYSDLQWVVQPEFAIRPLNIMERLKLKLSGKQPPKNIGPILPALIESYPVLNKYDLISGEYVLFSAGSGGHELEGKLASDVFFEAALKFVQISGIKVIFIFGSNYPNELPASDDILVISHVPADEFLVLLNETKASVLSAGSTLLQAIEMRKPCVSIAISKDQPARLTKCSDLSLVLESDCEATEICDKAIQLLDEEVVLKMVKQMEKLIPTDGVTLALNDIELLLK